MDWLTYCLIIQTDLSLTESTGANVPYLSFSLPFQNTDERKFQNFNGGPFCTKVVRNRDACLSHLVFKQN